VYDPYQVRRPPRILPYVLVAVFVAVTALILLYAYDVGAFTSGGGGRPVYPFLGIFFFILILSAILFAVRMAFWSRMWTYRAARPRPPGGFRDPAIMTVRQRYARGEITREQYDQLISELTRRRYGP
jgi:uncharacterized membrane protein